jgi:hypothetical protein
MQTPWVERPPATPSIRRQGHIAAQLHDSKYVPQIRQVNASAPSDAACTVSGPFTGRLVQVALVLYVAAVDVTDERALSTFMAAGTLEQRARGWTRPTMRRQSISIGATRT